MISNDLNRLFPKAEKIFAALFYNKPRGIVATKSANITANLLDKGATPKELELFQGG